MRGWYWREVVEAVAVVECLLHHLASSTEGQCFGDSGGPAFLARPIRPGVAEIRAQVGVLSQVGAGDGWCGGALDRYVNLAAHVEWIDDAVASLGGSRLLRV